MLKRTQEYPRKFCKKVLKLHMKSIESWLLSDILMTTYFNTSTAVHDDRSTGVFYRSPCIPGTLWEEYPKEDGSWTRASIAKAEGWPGVGSLYTDVIKGLRV